MKWFTMSLHDAASKTFLPPFNVRHQGEARRHFAGSVNGNDSMIAQNPADFTLFIIGSFDDEMGVLTPVEHVSLGNGVTYKQRRDEGLAIARPKGMD